MAGTIGIDECKALLELQRLDLALDELSAQTSNLPHKAKVASFAQKIAEGESLIAKSQSGITDIDQQVGQKNTVIAQLKDKIEREQEKIDEGNIDYRQIEKVSTDIAVHQARIGGMESEVLDLLEVHEALKKRISGYQEKLIGLAQGKEQVLNAYKQQLGILAAKTMQITALRDEKRALVSNELLERYDALRAQRKGIVVATFDGVRCSACALALPTALTGDLNQSGDVGVCSECHRILVCVEESDDE